MKTQIEEVVASQSFYLVIDKKFILSRLFKKYQFVLHMYALLSWIPKL